MQSELLDANCAAVKVEEQAELTAFGESERDSFFAMLRSELDANGHSGLDPRQ